MTLHTYYQCNGCGERENKQLLPFGWVELEDGKHWCLRCLMKWNREIKEIEGGIGN